MIVGLSVGGQDVVYMRQDKSSNMASSEVKQHLDKLGDQLFTGTCTLPPPHLKSKDHKLKVSLLLPIINLFIYFFFDKAVKLRCLNYLSPVSRHLNTHPPA